MRVDERRSNTNINERITVNEKKKEDKQRSTIWPGTIMQRMDWRMGTAILNGCP